MVRLLLTVLTTIVFVAFALSNTHRVPFSFVFGETEVRLIFLLLVSFVAGVMTILIHSTLEDARRRAMKKEMRVAMSRGAMLQDEVE
jgi:uncharacterized integral membrane protein